MKRILQSVIEREKETPYTGWLVDKSRLCPDHQTYGGGVGGESLWTGRSLELGQAHMGGTLLFMAGWVNEEKKVEQDRRAERGEEQTHISIIC